MMDAEAIRKSLKSRKLGARIYSLDTIDSTNTFARKLRSEEAPHGTLIVAEEQTAGKGRQGRRWQSQRGKNLLFSIVLRTPYLQERARILPFVGALAAADAIEQLTPCSVECKWPNDLLVDKKKIAGMLIEAEMRGDEVTAVVMGIGINVNQTEFPEEIRDKATSLRVYAHRDIDRVLLLCRAVEELEHRLDQLQQFSPQVLLDDWKRRTTMFGTRITILEQNSRVRGTALDVAPDGSLVIEDEKGVKREVSAGDVTLG